MTLVGTCACLFLSLCNCMLLLYTEISYFSFRSSSWVILWRWIVWLAGRMQWGSDCVQEICHWVNAIPWELIYILSQLFASVIVWGSHTPTLTWELIQAFLSTQPCVVLSKTGSLYSVAHPVFQEPLIPLSRLISNCILCLEADHWPSHPVVSESLVAVFMLLLCMVKWHLCLGITCSTNECTLSLNLSVVVAIK